MLSPLSWKHIATSICGAMLIFDFRGFVILSFSKSVLVFVLLQRFLDQNESIYDGVIRTYQFSAIGENANYTQHLRCRSW